MMYDKLSNILINAATYLLRKEAKRLKVGIKDVDVSKITKFRGHDNVDKGKKTGQNTSREEDAGFSKLPKLKAHCLGGRPINTEEWPNLEVK